MNKNYAVFSGFTAYLFFWGLAVFTGGIAGNVIFTFLYLMLSCVFIPLVIVWKFGIKMKYPVKLLLYSAGIIYLILFTTAGIFSENNLELVIKNRPGLEEIIKYLILFVPMSFGVTMYCFYLIPSIFDEMMPGKILKIIVPVFSSGAACGLSFFIDKKFGVEMFVIMFIMGLFYGVGYVLIKSFYIMWFFFFVSMMFHTLGEAKYFNYSWTVLMSQLICFGFLFSIWIYIIKKKTL